jgi:ABC-type glycerol-3-phosphate transport system permease component
MSDTSAITNIKEKVSSNWKTYLIVLVVIIIILLGIWWYYSTKNKKKAKLIGNSDGKTMKQIPKSELPMNIQSMGQGHFSLTFKIYLENWEQTTDIKEVYSGGPLAIFLEQSINNLGLFLVTDSDFKMYQLENIPVYQWTYIGITIGDKVMDIYRDGFLIGSIPYQGQISDIIQDITISGNGGFNGKLEDFEFHDRKLTANDIHSICNPKRPSGFGWIKYYWNELKNTSSGIYNSLIYYFNPAKEPEVCS